MGCHSLLQGIVQIQGSKLFPSLLHWQVSSLPLVLSGLYTHTHTHTYIWHICSSTRSIAYHGTCAARGYHRGGNCPCLRCLASQFTSPSSNFLSSSRALAQQGYLQFLPALSFRVSEYKESLFKQSNDSFTMWD